MIQPATTPSTPGRPPATPPQTPASSSQSSTRPQPRDSSVKETLESILVAFILAFIFRAFVVEAFVIPTGSMAPTLLGAHMRFHCPDCGYRFDTNYSPNQNGDELIIPSQAPSDKTYRVFCPNCGFKFPQVDSTDPENDATQPPVHYGDRILVLKYLYLLREPRRWDVVVFKSPDNDPNGGPPSYQQNYIKRLVGKPGESIMILDGDIYTGKGGQAPGDYTIATKPKYVQDALWRIIYDNDYHPQSLSRFDGATWKQPWSVHGGSGWDLDSAAGGRVFKFNNPAGKSDLAFDRTANPWFDRQQTAMPTSFTDWLAYDLETDPAGNTVHDLKLSFVYDRAAGNGPLRATMTSGDDTFTAVISPTDIRLMHKSATDEQQVGSPMALSGHHDPIRVELTNVDYEVTLRVDDKIVARSTPQDYRPNVSALLEEYKLGRTRPTPTVGIEAENQTASVSHVGLWRDIYYINRGRRADSQFFAGTPNNIMHLGDDEYFVLGDNSLISGDARYWSVPIDLPADQLQVGSGRVPGRFLLGRAFFVYWPAGFRPAPALPGITPNFGDMRFIR